MAYPGPSLESPLHIHERIPHFITPSKLFRGESIVEEGDVGIVFHIGVKCSCECFVNLGKSEGLLYAIASGDKLF